MEIIVNGGGGMKKFMEKNGFHIILFICVCILAVIATMVSKENKKDENEEISKTEDFTIVDEEKTEPSMEIAHMEEFIPEDYLKRRYEETLVEKEEEEEEEEEEKQEEEEEFKFVIEEKEPSENMLMISPVDGTIGTVFTTDSLVYSKTLEKWTSHKGIDILAEEGTEVKAALSGTIMEVYEDKLWGIVIIIDHGEGFMTKYANLATKDMVVEGQKVSKGEPISKVGNTAAIEMMMTPHLHFEVIEDGVNIDPIEVLPAFSQSQ